MPEASSDGNFAITWVDAKGGAGFADVTVEEKIGASLKVFIHTPMAPPLILIE